MAQQVEAPDGTLVEFPDGMSDAQIAQAMRREYGGPKKTSQTLGFMKGITAPINNFQDAVDATPVVGNILGSTEWSRANRAQVMGDIERREETEKPGMVGNILGAAVGTAPVMAVTRNPFLAGGLQGALTSDADDAMGLVGDVAAGAVLNKVGDKVAGLAARALKPIADPAVEMLTKAGVKLSPGQMRGGRSMVREDKAMSRPAVGELIAKDRGESVDTWNRATLERALDPIGIKLPQDVATGHDAVVFAQQAVSDAYDTIVPKMRIQVDKRFVAGLRNVYQGVQSLPEAQQKQFGSVLEAVRFGNGGQLAGRKLKDAQGELSRLSSTYSASAAAPDRELGRAIGELRGEVEALMVRQNPALAPALKKVNQAFRGLATVETAAAKADGGIISPAQLKTAVRQADGTRRKKATAGGQAYMQDWAEAARKVIPARTPDSGTAGRLQSGNLLAEARGAADALGYRIDRGIATTVATNPAARKAADALLKLRPYLGFSAGLLPQSAKD